MEISSSWQPTSSIETLIKRAKIIKKIRDFFADRGILEVETPLLSAAAVTDLHLSSFTTIYNKPGELNLQNGQKFSLITSPEYHMKRLISAGSGPIFQICKCFRNHEEVDKFHHPEFTMLEWYRIQFDMMQMINEVDDLLQIVLGCEPAEHISYQTAFIKHLNLDPFDATKDELTAVIDKLNIGFDHQNEELDTLLQVAFTFGVEPHIGQQKPTVIYHFPASQAALAEICCEDHRAARRFEFYYKGVELSNGFKELVDENEQRARFKQDNQLRIKNNLQAQPLDEHLLAAMNNGLPPCAGVAVGLDRLIMLALNKETISQVTSFNLENA